MRRFRIATIIAILACSLFSCDKSDPGSDDPEVPAISDTILRVNKFINEDMSTYYLWSAEMPSIDYTLQSDPYKYFDSLLYVDDKWSWLTDDYEALVDYLSGTETSYGYSLIFGKFNNVDAYFAIIEYVDANTPAKRAGLKRGDIITSINGASITDDNYTELYYSSSITIGLGVLSSNGISNGETISMTSEALTTDPVLMSKVIDLDENNKVGYLVYTQYLTSGDSRVDEVFSEFREAGITDLVLDLRYNSGGAISSAQHLCSSIAPWSDVSSSKRLINITWNDQMESYFRSHNEESMLYVNFDNTVASNVNLNRLYVLTTSSTASASEFTIASLMPYMDLVVIGDNTSGKYTASMTISPQVYDSRMGTWVSDDMISNWAMQPIVYKWENVDGLSDFKDGLAPDYYVEDQLLPTYPLGDLSEPLLNKALELIGGGEIYALKSASKLPASHIKFSLPEMPKTILERASETMIHDLKIRE